MRNLLITQRLKLQSSFLNGDQEAQIRIPATGLDDRDLQHLSDVIIDYCILPFAYLPSIKDGQCSDDHVDPPPMNCNLRGIISKVVLITIDRLSAGICEEHEDGTAIFKIKCTDREIIQINADDPRR